MTSVTTTEISGWGRYPRAIAQVATPENVQAIDPRAGSHLIARGLGRSYGDAAMLADGIVLLCERLNRTVSFDEATGLLTAEAGLSLREVLHEFVPRGWFPPVVPGTKSVTLGGCVAADIHGKNHHRDGTFGEHLSAFRLLLADGSHVLCSREHNSELFWATIGGMGLTGVITQVTMKLLAVTTAYVVVEHQRAKNLDESLELFESKVGDDQYTVAWLDCFSHGSGLGRSILIRGHHAGIDELPANSGNRLTENSPREFDLRFDFPSWLLNPFTVRWFNELYYRRQGRRRSFISDYDSFFFPLDRIRNWNRMYGRRGFVQYQCVLPGPQSRLGLQLLLEEARLSKRPSFLTVLKRFGPEGSGLLSFPMAGYTLTMDFPVSDVGLFTFLERLDEIVVKHGGRVYLAKDARLGADVFRRMYSRLDQWLEVKRRFDPSDVFTSDLARRIGLISKP